MPTSDEIRQLSGQALFAEVERVSGLRMQPRWIGDDEADPPDEYWVWHGNQYCGSFPTESDASLFIAANLLEDAERRGWAAFFGRESGEGHPWNCIFKGNLIGQGTLPEAVCKAYLLAASVG